MSTSVNAATSKHPRVIDSTSPEKRDEHIRNLPGDKCPHCNQICTIESEAIQCDLCSNWVHAQCEGISSELYKSFSHVSSGIAIIYRIVVKRITAVVELNNLSLIISIPGMNKSILLLSTHFKQNKLIYIV